MQLTARTPAPPRRERGIMLLEALIGLLLFSIGILAMVAMQAIAVQSAADARYRTEAVAYADDLLGEILLGVDRSSAATLTASLNAFQHQPGGGACSFNGAASGNAAVTGWVNEITGVVAGTRPPLPRSDAGMQQVLVDTSPAGRNRVRITICWQGPQDPVPRQHFVATNVY